MVTSSYDLSRALAAAAEKLVVQAKGRNVTREILRAGVLVSISSSRGFFLKIPGTILNTTITQITKSSQFFYLLFSLRFFKQFHDSIPSINNS